MNSVVIDITGHPVAKGRARFGKNGAVFTPAKTRKWEADARMVARQAMGARQPFTGPIGISVEMCFPVPASWPKWKREAAMRGEVMHTTKPDADNVVKAAKDACNGIAWLDDAQVYAATITKRYGETPRVLVHVFESDMLTSQAKRKKEVITEEVSHAV